MSLNETFETMHSGELYLPMEKELFDALGVHCSIHLDPIAVGDAQVDSLREKALETVRSVDERLNIHDFRIVPG